MVESKETSKPEGASTTDSKLIRTQNAQVDGLIVVESDPLATDMLKQAAAQEEILPAFLKGVFINGKSKCVISALL